MRADLFPMETLAELKTMLKRLEAKWESGNTGDSHELMRMDKQMKEIRKKIHALKS